MSKPWYSLPPGKERERLKAEAEAEAPEIFIGPRPHDIKTTKDGIACFGKFYSFDIHGKALARLLAQSGCDPLPDGCEVIETKRTITVNGIEFKKQGMPAGMVQISYDDVIGNLDEKPTKRKTR